MLRFTVNLTESTREISITNNNRRETIQLGIISDISIRNNDVLATRGIPDQMLKATTENFSDESVQFLEKLQSAFPNNVSLENKGTSLDFSILISERMGFDLSYVG